MSRAWPTPSATVAAVASGAALALGLLTSLAPGLVLAMLVAAISLLPFAVHVRWVGLRRALTEPSAATIILIFYVFVFPLRGLAIALSGYDNVGIARDSVNGGDLVAILLLASVGTTAIIEMFHLFRSRRPRRPVVRRPAGNRQSAVTLAAGVMCGVALLSIFIFVTQKGGLAATQTEQLSHSKELALSGARSIALSLWAILSVPAIWSATLVAVDRGSPRLRRTLFIAFALLILAIQVSVFGSRLDALLSVLGAWVIVFYSGRRVPIAAVVTGIVLFILLSVPILNQRIGGETPGNSALERYSVIAGYSVLDAGLAVRQEPREVRAKLEDSSRWVDLPQYLVPSFLWPGRPTLESRRLDLYIAQSIGTSAQQESGLPTTYITELWIYGGLLVVLVVSLAIGAALGTLHRRLVGSKEARRSPANLLWYGFIVSFAFTYYKDGDLLTTTVGTVREAIYVGLILLACGVWTPLARRGRRTAVALPATAHSGAAQQ